MKEEAHAFALYPDFRSPDGLYASMKAGTLDRGSQSPSLKLSETKPGRTPAPGRLRRAAAVHGEHARQAIQLDEDVFKIADLQELASIEVFRRHPEVF